MPDLVVFEDCGYAKLLPLTYWRNVSELRCGCDSLLDKCERAQGARASLMVRDELRAVVAARLGRAVNEPLANRPTMFVNGRLLLRERLDLPPDSAVWCGDTLLAAHVGPALAARLTAATFLDLAACRAQLGGLTAAKLPPGTPESIDYPWHLVARNADELTRQLSAASSRTGRIDRGACLLNESAIHVAAGAIVKPGAVLDAESGPIHVAAGAVISPNVTIQGPCFIGPDTLVQPAAIVRGGCSIGPQCKIGGEIEGTIFHGHSNKQHHGFLGHSYVGEWVNLGAGSVNSDLKNTYGPVRVAVNGKAIDSGERFVGAFIGDHAKVGINVALPTGCVIGFAANVFVSRHPPKFVPSFAWLTDAGTDRFDPQKAMTLARTVMERRKVAMTPAEEKLFLSIVEQSKKTETR